MCWIYGKQTMNFRQQCSLTSVLGRYLQKVAGWLVVTGSWIVHQLYTPRTRGFPSVFPPYPSIIKHSTMEVVGKSIKNDADFPAMIPKGPKGAAIAPSHLSRWQRRWHRRRFRCRARRKRRGLCGLRGLRWHVVLGRLAFAT